MNILVTGGSGLVGKAIQELINETFNNKMSEKRYRFLSSKDCDLTQYDKVYDLFKNWTPDVVIHLACNVGGLFKNMNRKIEMFEDNLMINYCVLKCCRIFKVKRIINCLSTCVFPDDIEYPIDETMLHNGPPHHSNYGYAYVKRLIEIQTSLYSECLGTKVINLIPTNIYGKHDNFNLEDSHVIPALIHKAHLANITNKNFVVRGSGNPQRQFIYSKDFAKIILKSIDLRLKENLLNLIVSPQIEFSIKDIAYTILDIIKIDRNKIEFDTQYADGQIKKTASNKKLLELFPDFKFTSLEQGLVETIYWFNKEYPNIRL